MPVLQDSTVLRIVTKWTLLHWPFDKSSECSEYLPEEDGIGITLFPDKIESSTFNASLQSFRTSTAITYSTEAIAPFWEIEPQLLDPFMTYLMIHGIMVTLQY